MSRYDHAAELQCSSPLDRQLAFLVKELGAWADLNPGLRSLHAEFARVSGELTETARTEAVPTDDGDLSRECPSCHAKPHHPCRSRSGQTLWHYVHKARRPS